MPKDPDPKMLLSFEDSTFRKKSDVLIFKAIAGFFRFVGGGKKTAFEHRGISFLYWLRKDKYVTKLLGKVNRLDNRRIEMDITYQCNLGCFNCDRSCAQAPSDISMTLEQIQKFIDESIAQARTWDTITLLGGEPTLHPELNKIIEMLLTYIRAYSPLAKLFLVSNGYGKQVQEVLARINPEVTIVNTAKGSRQQNFQAFNRAPIDQKEYRHVDFTNGCPIIVCCGLSLNAHGYYPCGAGGGIDRVFGFNIGKKTLPVASDGLLDQLDALCRYCGHFCWDIYESGKTQINSPVWEKAYARMRIDPPRLTRY